MTKEEFKKQQQRVENYKDLWEEICIYEQALAELEHDADTTLTSLTYCIQDYGLKKPVKKLVEARLADLRKELDSI